MSQNPQMDVFYLQGIGQVLGIFTRNAEPQQMETDPSAFVGDGLHLRGIVTGEDLVVAPNLIAIFRTDRNWRQILQPQSLYVTGPPPALTTFSLPSPGILYTAGTKNLAITPATFVTANSGNSLVLALDDVTGVVTPFPFQFSSSAASANVVMSGLTSGDSYHAVVFVPQYPITTYQFTAA
jgi:hypothetical protein